MKKKPLLIFLHGLGGNGLSFKPLINQLWKLEDKFEFVSFDFWGFGGTPVPTSMQRVSMKVFAEQTAHEILQRNQQEARSVHLIGHSMGGAVAVEMHRLFPELQIDSFMNLEGNLQLEDCTTSKKVSKQSREEFCQSQFEDFKKEVKDIARSGDIAAKYWISGLEGTTAEVFYDTSTDLVRVSTHLYPMYRDWDTYTVYVFGEETLKRSHGTYERLLKDDKNIAVVPQAGHVMHVEQPQATAEICRTHLSGV